MAAFRRCVELIQVRAGYCCGTVGRWHELHGVAACCCIRHSGKARATLEALPGLPDIVMRSRQHTAPVAPIVTSSTAGFIRAVAAAASLFLQL